MPKFHDKKKFGPLCDYIRVVANHMGLCDWQFEVEWIPIQSEDGDTQEYANCRPIFGRKYAVLKFSVDALDSDEFTLRNTVVHELVHCHLAQAQSFFENEVYDFTGKPLPWNIMWDGFKRALEYGVDGIAAGWSETLPYIKWEVNSKSDKVKKKSKAEHNPTTHIGFGWPEGY